jgi:hypothetical protein
MHRKYISMSWALASSKTLAVLLGFGLLANFPLVTLATANPGTSLAESAEITRVRSQAAQYTQAMSEIASIGTTSIKTKDAAERVVDSIRKTDAMLVEGLPKRLTVIALDNRTFKLAIEQETAKFGPKVFRERVTANPQVLFSIRGAAEIKSAIARQLQTDAATLKQTAAYLKRVAQENRQTNNHSNYVRPEPAVEFDPYMSPQGGVGETLIVAALVGAAVLLIGSYAAILAKGHEVPPATEQNPNPVSPVAKCLDEAIARREHCLSTSDAWGDLLCIASYLVDRADCILLPQA